MILKELRERLKNSENNYGPYTEFLLGKLGFLLLDDEKIVDGIKGTYSSCPAILVATEQRVLLLFRGDQELVYSEILNYEEMSNIRLNVSLVKEEMVIRVNEQEFILKDLSNTYNHEVYYYILNRIKNTNLPILDNLEEPLEGGEPESLNHEISGFMELVFACAPATTFISFFIMGWRAKSSKYFLTSLFYFISTMFLFANGSMGLILIMWIIGLVHFGCEDEGYTLQLNEVARQKHTEPLKQIEDVVTIDLPKNDVALVPEKGILKVNPYIEKMRQLNIAIEDETVSNYLDEMESICQDIFIYVEKHPEKEVGIRNFINYYLPQTFSLLEKYDDLSEKEIKTANIEQAMDEITGALSVIVEAFRNLYNQLYENEVVQISVEIQVLKNVLAQHGLVGKDRDFDLKN